MCNVYLTTDRDIGLFTELNTYDLTTRKELKKNIVLFVS